MNKIGWTKKVNLLTKHRYILLFLGFVIMLLDQLSKYIVHQHIQLYDVIPVIDQFWNWTLTYNKGAAFSFLANHEGNWPKIFFGIVALLVSIGIIHFILSKSYSKLTGIAMCFILGGATGNLVDRIIHGKVTDFIQWYYHNHYWPTFNLADAFICVGVTFLIIEGIFFSKEDKEN
ncbi:MAG: signal peptidase II [Burkholderiales bacterium]|nr:signal peptidase II [Burkholderiales bacterium]